MIELTAGGFKAELARRRLESTAMRTLFDCAKDFQGMELGEIEELLESEVERERLGAVCIMDFEARDKKVPAERKRELYELYMRRHDRINSWDMVDRSAPYVVGGYLADKSREPLYELARTGNIYQKRTAIVATYFFIRRGEIEDTFSLAEILVEEHDEIVCKPVGSWVREAGKRDEERLLAFLHKYAAIMPRASLRYAIEKLPAGMRKHYMELR